MLWCGRWTSQGHHLNMARELYGAASLKAARFTASSCRIAGGNFPENDRLSATAPGPYPHQSHDHLRFRVAGGHPPAPPGHPLEPDREQGHQDPPRTLPRPHLGLNRDPLQRLPQHGEEVGCRLAAKSDPLIANDNCVVPPIPEGPVPPQKCRLTALL